MIVESDTLRVLASFHYFRNVDMAALADRCAPMGVEFFADSGAYSAMNAGAAIVLDEYIDWIERHRDVLAVYANLDVIGDGETAAAATYENQRRMEDRGLRPLPVFHAGEPFDWLERYLAEGYTYIALGGLVGRPVTSVMPWLIRCFQMAGDKAVFHGFGVTSTKPLQLLPWFSADSSTWSIVSRFARIDLFDPRTGRMTGQHNMRDHARMYRHADLIRAYGEDPHLLVSLPRAVPADTRRRLLIMSRKSWQQLERWMVARFGPVEIPDGPKPIEQNGLGAHPVGPRLYLAQANLAEMLLAAGVDPSPQPTKEPL